MTRPAALLLALAAMGAGCAPADPEAARRAAYLDCARAQGVPVSGGTIRTGPGDLARLEACAALPRFIAPEI